jgi:hypothetical protein
MFFSDDQCIVKKLHFLTVKITTFLLQVGYTRHGTTNIPNHTPLHRHLAQEDNSGVKLEQKETGKNSLCFFVVKVCTYLRK